MPRLLLVVLPPCLCILFGQLALAQSGGKGESAFEVFQGYTNLDVGAFNADGWNVAVSWRLSDWFSVEGDFSYAFQNDERTFTLPGESQFDVLRDEVDAVHGFVGGKFDLRYKRFRPFARLMAGVEHLTFNRNVSSRPDLFRLFDREVTTVVVSSGGGLDVILSDRFALRPFQFDYIVPIGNEFETDNKLRFSTGVVFRF